METPKISVCEIQYQVQQQQMFINGQQSIQEIKTPYLVCSRCNNIIATFNPNTPEVSICTACQNELEGNIKYCSHCGYKLQYPKMFVLSEAGYSEL